VLASSVMRGSRCCLGPSLLQRCPGQEHFIEILLDDGVAVTGNLFEPRTIADAGMDYPGNR
jgi:hypothetical protein